MKTVDAGYFATTPFFISFCDRAVQQRSAYYSYLLALAYRYTGDTKLAQKYIEQAAVSDPYALNIFCRKTILNDLVKLIWTRIHTDLYLERICMIRFIISIFV